jgi:mono/diheme cytochrome c family protein
MTLTPKRLLCLASCSLVFGIAAPRAAAAQDAKRGAEVYAAQKCQVCHSIAGTGGKSSPLDGAGNKLTGDEIRQWITHPKEMTAKTKSTKKPPMPAKWTGLPAADLDALVAYVSSLK